SNGSRASSSFSFRGDEALAAHKGASGREAATATAQKSRRYDFMARGDAPSIAMKHDGMMTSVSLQRARRNRRQVRPRIRHEEIVQRFVRRWLQCGLERGESRAEAD